MLSSGVRRPTKLAQNIVESTASYDQWLLGFLSNSVVKSDMKVRAHACVLACLCALLCVRELAPMCLCLYVFVFVFVCLCEWWGVAA